MYLCRATKLANLRVFEDPETGKAWDKSVSDLGLEILCVSQVSSNNYLCSKIEVCPSESEVLLYV